ncbi:hypothetical protein ETAA8_31730 [Anatilimnocola aggregata]|uniref:Uncharacterized protein n=1 Tax=Anatilimnocola aggregata TaxID=2528021 RepID=A0A517YCX0_9BACT|nr:hypothetical protein [Anatilimnocola aggregata]QDU28080.1 hypothetical protein ETAA8_31730 [Anatilimnocola aggregata]
MTAGTSATRFRWPAMAGLAIPLGLWMLGLLPAVLIAQEEPAPKEAASPGTPAVNDDLALEQERLASKYARLEELLLKMSSLEGGSNPRRAALLLRAVEQSKEKLTKTQLESVVKLLGQKQLKRALDGQSQVQTDLKSLLDLLMSEDRSDRLKSEQQRIKEYIKEVERLIRLQKSLEGQTEGGADLQRVAKEQENLGGRTGDLAKKIKENEEGSPPKPADDESEEKKPGEEQPGEQKPGEQKPGEQKPGEQKPGEQKPGEQKPGEQKPGEQKPGEQKPGEQKPGEQKPGEQNPGEQKPGEQKPGEQSDSKSGDQQQQQQAKQENPARKRLEQAEEKMKAAQKKLAEAKRKESAEEQRQAKEELEKAKAELEEILRQLREEEVQRTLAALEARFRKMLEMQLKVYESTRRLDQVVAANRSDQFVVESGRLGFDERKIAVEARKALTLLQEEGSSIAFPATVEQMEEDMLQVSERLAETKIDDITIGLEEDIISSLEEMIAALEKAQQDAEQKKQQQQQQQQQQQEQEQPLVDKIAELKMIKSLQERVNKRTVRYSRLLEDDQDVVGQAESADLLAALKALADRQKEIFGITRDIVLEKNK